MKDWRTDLLHSMGYKPTKANLRFLANWQRWEGGHTNNSARFNWLNTTHGDGESINSVGVKRFGSYDQGIRATAETLMNGRYQDILDGLQSGDPFHSNIGAGLQVWVSGRPNGNPGYAQKVLGGRVSSTGSPSPARAPRPAQAPKAPAALQGESDWQWTMDFVFGEKDPEFAALMRSLPDPTVAVADPGPTRVAQRDVGKEMRATGKVLSVSPTWEGTHVTDNLDWNNGRKTARDIMAAAGTTVLAPESGTVVRWGGAQGGQAMYFMSDSGHLYWLGHIDSMAQVGTRVKRGQRLALISADHAAPHLHIDRYYGKNPGRFT